MLCASVVSGSVNAPFSTTDWPSFRTDGLTVRLVKCGGVLAVASTVAVEAASKIAPSATERRPARNGLAIRRRAYPSASLGFVEKRRTVIPSRWGHVPNSHDPARRRVHRPMDPLLGEPIP